MQRERGGVVRGVLDTVLRNWLGDKSLKFLYEVVYISHSAIFFGIGIFQLFFINNG